MSDRSEEDVISALSPGARKLLKRVLEIERERLHVKGADASVVEDILTAVRGVVP